MDFIEAAKKRDNNVWGQIMEVCRGAARKYIKTDNEAIEEIVSMSTAKLMEQIDIYEPERGRGNIEANFIQWINNTTEFEITHWREKNKKMEERYISIEDLAWTFGHAHDDDMDLSEAGENIISHITYREGEGHNNNPEFQLALKEVIDVIIGFGDIHIQKTNIHHYIYGRTTKEIAVILGEKESTVNNWIHRNKEAIKRRLREKGIDTTYLDRDKW
ncbi:MAG: hypothetical protein N3D15_01515 [Syntrophorhabdaceae bacterium]|nr:hypothetical protein [Syntrophorhabdaceae bacterium]